MIEMNAPKAPQETERCRTRRLKPIRAAVGRAAGAVAMTLDDATLGAATETELAAMRGLCAVLRVASVNEFLAAQRYITDFKLEE